MLELRVEIRRYIDDSQPGWVECRLIDAHGKEWSFIDKVPIFSAEELDASSRYPRPGGIACQVVERRREPEGRELVVIDTELPDHVEATCGETRFEVRPDQLAEFG